MRSARCHVYKPCFAFRIIMLINLALLLLLLPGLLSSAELRTADPFPSFEVKEAVTDQDYKYLGLTKGSFFSKGKRLLNDISGELLLVEFLNRYCMVCQKDAPEFNKLFDTIEKETALKGKAKIETNPAEPVRLVTVRGAGYRFEG